MATIEQTIPVNDGVDVIATLSNGALHIFHFPLGSNLNDLQTTIDAQEDALIGEEGE